MSLSIQPILSKDARVIVVLVLCVTSETGPLFIANGNRICVGITRQIGALFVIGDIDTAPPDTGSKENNQVQEGDDGEADLIKSKEVVLTKHSELEARLPKLPGTDMGSGGGGDETKQDGYV
ncbi:hypothetical protein B0J15DRAFT_477939 [Fusarium solani]|uniref:DNA2/NAM7 helicase-like C-terminal domain-containing protein n=1 Tax=Fusarium solani TaxID=169388 RepID=A0A9P9L4A8_FUSSL|nr:uncharacterized protein B0J15DRAFT_477939 [Fusarium solani]KAH7273747.1 hypothetical protein B0J15DRAFT_477939 [Fusarium solani]